MFSSPRFIMARLSTRRLEDGLTVTIVAGYAYGRVSVTEARRWLVLEAMQPEYENKSLVDVEGGADRFVTSRHVTEDGIRDCLLSRGLGDVYKRQS